MNLPKPYFRTNLGVLYHGDCLDIIPMLNMNVDLILTDPPYNIHTGKGGIITREKKKYLANIDNGFGSIFSPREYLNQSKDVMNKYNAYWWCSRSIVSNYLNFAKDNDFDYDILIWNKSNPMPLKNNKYLPDTEICIFMRNKVPYFNNDLRYDCYRKVYRTSVQKSFKGHPTPKPIKIISTQLLISSKQDDLILDPFLGSGTTAIACERLNRRWIGIEINLDYVKIAKERIKKETAQYKMELV